MLMSSVSLSGRGALLQSMPVDGFMVHLVDEQRPEDHRHAAREQGAIAANGPSMPELPWRPPPRPAAGKAHNPTRG
jgi:hypothetical protein